MLELRALNGLNAAEEDPTKTKSEKSNIMMAKTAFIVLYLVLLGWAFMRALKCSQATPDSRVLHLMFAMFSPVLYIAFSYLIPGMKPESNTMASYL